MKVQFGLLSLILLIGAAQGIVLSSAVVIVKSKKPVARLFLALLIFTFSVHLLVSQLVQSDPEMFGSLVSSTDPFLYLFGPLIYLYTYYLTDPQKGKPSLNTVLHFLPFFVGYLALIPVYTLSKAGKIDFYQDLISNRMPWWYTMGWILECLHLTCYLFLAIKLLNQFNVKLKDSYSCLDRINLNWLKSLLLTNAGIWILYTIILIVYLINLNHTIFINLFLLFSFLSAALIYYIAYKALLTPVILTQKVFQPTSTSDGLKYSRSGLTPEKRELYKSQIAEMMGDESFYLNPELTLNDLSNHLNIPGNHISQTINQEFGMNFFDFVNGYRVQDAKEWLSDPIRSKQTMLAIAFECGFKSKSTFNAAFKKHTGNTPSEYKKSNQQLKSA